MKKDGESKKGKEAAKELKKQLIQMKRNSGEGQIGMSNDMNPNIFQCGLCLHHNPVNQLTKLESHMHRWAHCYIFKRG